MDRGARRGSEGGMSDEPPLGRGHVNVGVGVEANGRVRGRLRDGVKERVRGETRSGSKNKPGTGIRTETGTGAGIRTWAGAESRARIGIERAKEGNKGWG